MKKIKLRESELIELIKKTISEQGSYDSELSLTHDGFMDEADRFCEKNEEEGGKGQFTGNRSCKRCKGEQIVRAYCAGKKKKELNENENWWEEDMIIAPCHSDCPPPWTPCGCLGMSQVTGIPPAELDPSMFDGNDDGFVIKNRDRLTRLGIAKFGRKGRGGRK